ncbi:hypothetical protein EBF03_05470 [Arcanobacterium haemolyticum]|uniref:hypothetical protein n=1 Tax=Arcanobacterium haemolyticum TaxID=28264 RepID=UPI0011100FAC|nr:hypothetical protein [Arcanobacterium haemolyticum]QCX46910.1 hypothetical protein EBF03_05470 [Arcanobacterium haemolyticum]
MRVFERPVMLVALLFTCVMAVVGWYSIVVGAGSTTGFIIGSIASLMVFLGVWGWRRESLNVCATAALGAGILFPTPFGLIPMICGFIIFTLIVSLDLFVTFNGE